ncbi:MAG: helix-turn-helix domain-containing protein [Kiritimatiellia bacterium]
MIAIHLGVKRDTVYKWVRLKGMPHHKLGRLVKFRQAEIDRWVTSGKAAK